MGEVLGLSNRASLGGWPNMGGGGMKILLLPLALSSAQDMSAFSCGDTTSASQFYFVSPAYPVSVGLANHTCTLAVDHGCPVKASPRTLRPPANSDSTLTSSTSSHLFSGPAGLTSSTPRPVATTLSSVGTTPAFTCTSTSRAEPAPTSHLSWRSSRPPCTTVPTSSACSRQKPRPRRRPQRPRTDRCSRATRWSTWPTRPPYPCSPSPRGEPGR